MKNSKIKTKAVKATKNTPADTFRRQIMAIARRRGEVSSVDLAKVQSDLTGPSRGAFMRNAFASLVNEGVLRVSAGEGVYNGAHRHRVSVYNPVKGKRVSTKRA